MVLCFGALSNAARVMVNVLRSRADVNTDRSLCACLDVYRCSCLALGAELLCVRTGVWCSAVVMDAACCAGLLGLTENQDTEEFADPPPTTRLAGAHAPHMMFVAAVEQGVVQQCKCNLPKPLPFT